MPPTEVNLDVQTDRDLTEPRIRTRMALKDDGATRSTFVDWDEPAGADRSVNIPDPQANTEFVLGSTPQTLSNKKYTGPTVAPDDMVNKDYVDTAVAGGGANATSAPGGGTEGLVTADEDLGLEITGGPANAVLGIKAGTGTQFDGSGNLQVVQALAGPGGATQGRVSADTLLGLDIVGGVMRAKVDGTTMQFNGAGELESLGGSGGAGTGTISRLIGFGQQIDGGVPQPADVLVGSDVSALQFPDGSLSGEKFEFQVPDDYAAGSLEFSFVYRMSTADPSNQIRISNEAEIVDVSAGTIDSATYVETQSNFLTPTTTDFVRQSVFTIASGDFAAGDKISWRFRRYGADGVNDTHGGALEVAAVLVAYDVVADSRVAVQPINFFEDAVGENPVGTGNLIGTDVSVTTYPTGTDAGQKFKFVVPDNWDEISPVTIRAVYAMSSASAGSTVRLNTYGEVVEATGGTISALGSVDFDFTPPNDTDPHQTTVLREIPNTAISKGDAVSLTLARRTAVGGNHPGDFELVSVVVTFRIAGTGAITAVTITEGLLGPGSFDNPSGPGVFSEITTDLADFNYYHRLRSTVAAGALDVSFAGRLGLGQTQVTSIKVTIKGVGPTPMYNLKVYAEGTGLVYSSGPTAAPLAPTEIVLTDLDLSAQPAAPQFRYFVVVEATINNGDDVLVGLPLVRQE